MALELTGRFDTAELPRIADQPVTVTVARQVEPGFEAQFLRWADDVVDTMAAFHGSLGAGVFHPGPDGGEYQIVFRFVDGIHLREWERSPQRAALMARADQFVRSERVQRTVGVDTFFALASNAETHRPLWRRILIDVAWVYPVALLVSLVVAPALAALPMVWRTLASAGLITAVMRLAIGPLRTTIRRRRRF
jgi:antibiotic biosynthesis monooxygenase (ABM) superfamily enzyme